MRVRKLMSAMAVVVMGCCVVTLSSAHAAGNAAITIQEKDNVKSVLTRLIGKQVKLTLVGNNELGGVVTKVNADVVHISELSGKEFYDAVVNIEFVSAVIVRTR